MVKLNKGMEIHITRTNGGIQQVTSIFNEEQLVKVE